MLFEDRFSRKLYGMELATRQTDVLINAFNARHVDLSVCSVLPQQAIAPCGATRVPV